MRILVQNCITKKFLGENGEWTRDTDEALLFESTLDALNYCLQHHVPDAEVVMKHERPELDVRLPVAETCR